MSEDRSSQGFPIELRDLNRDEARSEYSVFVTDGAFGWKDNNDAVIKGVNIKIKKDDLTMIVGQVGSGKSTLLKALLGETRTFHGDVYIATRNVSFCDQTPWLMYGTIKENIVGMTDFDPRWYNTVLEACALEKDLGDLPESDQTVIGSRVLALSGGQKQRIVSTQSL
jgi:ABC-type bacteriocin/lantibiotic exporter with double-glycine peptidase domain